MHKIPGNCITKFILFIFKLYLNNYVFVLRCTSCYLKVKHIISFQINNLGYFISILCVKGFLDIQILKKCLDKIIYIQISGDSFGFGFGWFKLVWKFLRKLLRNFFAFLSCMIAQYQENCSLNLADLFISLRMIASTLCKGVMIVLNLFSFNKMCVWRTERTKGKTQFWIVFSLVFAMSKWLSLLRSVWCCLSS